MLKDPVLYSVGVDYLEDDPTLVQKRADIVHSAAALLEKCHLIKYERSTGRFQSTELGRIASHYYVTYSSMATYNQHLRPTMSQLELFRVFALSNEFKLIPVRQDVSSLMNTSTESDADRLCRRSWSSASCSNVFPSLSRSPWRSRRRRLMCCSRPTSRN